MSKKLSYNYLLIALGLVLILLLLAALNLRTLLLEKYESYTLLKTQTDLIDQADQILLGQSKELKRLSGASKAYDTEEQSMSLNSAIDFGLYLESRCKIHGVRMISLPRESEENIAGFKALEENFSLEGRLKNLLALLYDLEKGQRVGSLSHLVLEKEELRILGKKKKVLTASITLKRLIEI